MTIFHHFDYGNYVKSSTIIEMEFHQNHKEIDEFLNKLDSVVNSCAQAFHSDSEAFALALNSHSLLLAAIRLAKSGHDSAVYPLLRTAFESATYALLISQDKELSKIWKHRHQSDDAFKENKTAFTPAMKKLRTILQEHDKGPNTTPYENYIMSLYDAAIDFGAHPNPITITNNTSRSDDGQLIKYAYLNHHNAQMIKSVIACLDFGLAISVVMHLSNVLNNGSSDGLDEKFTHLFEECNLLSDKVNGRAIGFENRYYKQINTYTKL